MSTNDEAAQAARDLADRIARDPCFITKVGSDGVAVESTVRHAYSWIWENGEMTTRMACSTCGKVKANNDPNPN